MTTSQNTRTFPMKSMCCMCVLPRRAGTPLWSLHNVQHLQILPHSHVWFQAISYARHNTTIPKTETVSGIFVGKFANCYCFVMCCDTMRSRVSGVCFL